MARREPTVRTKGNPARRRRKRDEKAWVVQRDEFHPDPREAAKHADRAALVAAAKSTTEEIARQDRRVEATTGAHDRYEARQRRVELTRDLARINRDLIAHDAEASDA
jgi:hypothetical protein